MEQPTFPQTNRAALNRYDLIYRNGPRRGESISIAQRVVIGRSEHCDLVLGTPDVSRKHCLIVRNADGVYILDLGSRNGTRVNGASISDVQAVKLRDRDKVQVGHWKFRWIEHCRSDQLAAPPQTGACEPTTDKKAIKLKLKSTPNSGPNSGADPPSTDILDELDAIAASLDLNVDGMPLTKSVSEIHDVPTTYPREPPPGSASRDSPSATSPPSKPDTATIDGSLAEESATQPSGRTRTETSKTVKSRAEQTQRELPGIPEHLRPKAPVDSQDAAQIALRRMFGG